jgi:hypothetical protein
MKTLTTTLFAAATVLASVVGVATTASAADATCQLRVTDRGSMLEIEPMVTASNAMDGSFDLAISGGGTEINHSGGFSAQAGTPVSLGVMNLSLGARYNAKLKINWKGGTIRCTEVLG